MIEAEKLIKDAMEKYISNMFDDDIVSLYEDMDDIKSFLKEYNLRCYPLSIIDEEYEGKSVTTFLSDCIQFDISDKYYYHGDRGIFTLKDISAVAALYREMFWIDDIVELVIELYGRINLPTGLEYLTDMLDNLEDYNDIEEVQSDINKYMDM